MEKSVTWVVIIIRKVGCKEVIIARKCKLEGSRIVLGIFLKADLPDL